VLRLPAILGIGLLSVTVVAEGAYIYKTRRQVDTLLGEVQRLSAERQEDDLRGGGARGPIPRFTEGPADEEPAARPAALPPPRFVPGAQPTATAPGAPVPLPPALDNPQAREQLRAFVAAELQRERDERVDRERQRRDDEQQRRLDGMVKALGLNPDQGRKFTEIMTSTQDARRQLREKVMGGQIPREEVGRQMTALREKTDQQLKEVIGDSGMKKLEELRQNDRRGGGGPGGGGPGEGFGRGGGPWGGGGRGRGEGGGAAPAPGSAPANPN
jgi:hypothetical protein